MQAIRDKHAFIERAPASAVVASFCRPSQTASQAQAVAPQDWDCWNFWCCCAAAASLAFTGTRTVCPAASRRRRGLQNRRARSQRAVKAATLPPRGLVYHPSCTHARMLARPESRNNPLKYSQTPFKPTQEPEP